MYKLKFAAAVILISAVSLFAQQWSAEQLEVWQNIETYWSLDDKGDLDGFLQYFDDSYSGWGYESGTPMNKEAVKKFLAYAYANEKTMLTVLTPLSIWVKGDIAYAHYTFRQAVESKDGKREMVGGRWTDILMRKGDKWVLVGDHGGRWEDD